MKDYRFFCPVRKTHCTDDCVFIRNPDTAERWCALMPAISALGEIADSLTEISESLLDLRVRVNVRNK